MGVVSPWKSLDCTILWLSWLTHASNSGPGEGPEASSAPVVVRLSASARPFRFQLRCATGCAACITTAADSLSRLRA